MGQEIAPVGADGRTTRATGLIATCPMNRNRQATNLRPQVAPRTINRAPLETHLLDNDPQAGHIATGNFLELARQPITLAPPAPQDRRQEHRGRDGGPRNVRGPGRGYVLDNRSAMKNVLIRSPCEVQIGWGGL